MFFEDTEKDISLSQSLFYCFNETSIYKTFHETLVFLMQWCIKEFIYSMTNLSSGHMFDYVYKLTVFSRVQGKFTTYELYEIYKKYHFVNVLVATKH